jgi:hypothetical protein
MYLGKKKRNALIGVENMVFSILPKAMDHYNRKIKKRDRLWANQACNKPAQLVLPRGLSLIILY